MPIEDHQEKRCVHLLGELFALLSVGSLGTFFGAMLTRDWPSLRTLAVSSCRSAWHGVGSGLSLAALIAAALAAWQ
jgi:hypothetical protein